MTVGNRNRTERERSLKVMPASRLRILGVLPSGWSLLYRSFVSFMLVTLSPFHSAECNDPVRARREPVSEERHEREMEAKSLILWSFIASSSHIPRPFITYLRHSL